MTTMDSSTASDDIPYCWCNADPTLVRTKTTRAPPSPTSSLMRVYDWPDSRDRHTNRSPSFPYRMIRDIIHKDCRLKGNIRQRGMYWWFAEQIKLEDKMVAGTLKPTVGEFYCFLEEEYVEGYNVFHQPETDTSKPPAITIFRYGNVFRYDPRDGYYWAVQSVAFPKGHPDADVPPYKMIHIMD